MKHFIKIVQQQFEVMCKTGKLFVSTVTGEQVWNTYISSFKPANNPVFRDPQSSSHNCNLCKNFIRRYGNIIAIDERGKITSMFSNFSDASSEYYDSAVACALLLERSEIKDVFFETFNELNSLPYESCNKRQEVFQLGIEKNFKRYTQEEVNKFGVVNTTDVYEFNHFNVKLPKQFVDMSGSSIEQIKAVYRDKYNVFERAMREIPLDTLHLVRDLINQGSLLDGTSHLPAIEQIIPYKVEYDKQSDKKLWCWVNSYSLHERIAKFKNTLVGVLCTELAEGKELNDACKAWNIRVDPVNYNKATAPITKKQIEEAKSFIEENGYEESFDRRLATIDDIKASEIKHINVGDGKIKSVSIFDGVKASPSTRHKRSEFEKVEEVTIEKFMSDILPSCSSVELFLENKMGGNLVTLTTSKNETSKPIFKWNNNYSWTFNGNLAGKSLIRDAVKSRGGRVEGDLRVSMHFPDTTDDYDLHMYEPAGRHIYYGNNRRDPAPSSGMLDLDAQGVDGHQPPEKRVENIIYSNKGKMPKGTYRVEVFNYSRRGLHTPFTVEIEAEGDTTTLVLAKTSRANNTATVATIDYDGREFTINPSSSMKMTDSKSVSKEMWGLESNNFHKVNLVCLSPNHWGDNKAGNLHYFFMLEGCKCNTPVRGFHNENLIPDLITHRKVMEVLGNSSLITPSDKQLSGVGFNSTVRDECIVKCSGSFKRMLKIKF